MASADFNRAIMKARRGLKLRIDSADFSLERLRDTYAGSSEQMEACDELVAKLDDALKVARELAALAHANASVHHGEIARPGLSYALRTWSA